MEDYFNFNMERGQGENEGISICGYNICAYFSINNHSSLVYNKEILPNSLFMSRTLSKVFARSEYTFNKKLTKNVFVNTGK